MSCRHESTEPVEVRDHVSGKPEIVARICRDCLDRLPAGWGCADCRWSEIRTYSGDVVKTVLSDPCEEHR